MDEYVARLETNLQMSHSREGNRNIVCNAGFKKQPHVNLRPLTIISELPKTGPMSGSTAVQA